MHGTANLISTALNVLIRLHDDNNEEFPTNLENCRSVILSPIPDWVSIFCTIKHPKDAGIIEVSIIDHGNGLIQRDKILHVDVGLQRGEATPEIAASFKIPLE